MPVSDDEISWAYRILLDREPESQQVVVEHRTLTDRRVLRDLFLKSEEFLGTSDQDDDIIRVGRFLLDEPRRIDTDCTPDELSAMLERIAREWTAFGERDAHWSVITRDEFRSQNIGDNEDAFYVSGKVDIARMVAMVRRNRPDARFGRALDFGCGVGRLSLALAEIADDVVGIDISPAHLVYARERAEKTGRTNVRFDAVTSIDALRGYGPFDVVLSHIVLQHNPPPVIAELLTTLLTSLAPSGIALFQLATYMPGYTFTVDDYLANSQPAMEMNALPQAVAFDIIAKAGCVPLEIREDGAIGAALGVSHTFLVERR